MVTERLPADTVRFDPHEIEFLLAHCEKTKAIRLRNYDWSVAHSAIISRDKASRQIELLDAMIAKLRALQIDGRAPNNPTMAPSDADVPETPQGQEQ